MSSESIKSITEEQAKQEVERLEKIYPVVRLMDKEELEEEDECLLFGVGCACMRKACERVLETAGKEDYDLKAGATGYQATARYVNVGGEPMVLLYAKPNGATVTESNVALYHDVLSGAYNRRYYEDILRKHRIFAGVAVIDLDDFKIVNDTLGHHAGDVALKVATRAVQSCIRDSDILVRFGGDEFVLVIHDITQEDFTHKLNDISEAVASAVVPGYEQIKLSVSVGGVLTRGGTVEDAAHKADHLMYQAKEHRGVVITDSDMDKILEKSHKPYLLIVDDSYMNREILKEMLKDDYDILEGENGKEGITILEEYGSEICLVLLDIVMPDMDGFDVLSRMVRSGWIDDIPVIMISSEDSDDSVLRAYELGASDYIGRPFDMRVVRQRVSNIMRLYAKQRRLSSLLTQQFIEREKNSSMLINIMGGAMELRNGESGPHVLNVRSLVEVLLERLLQKSDRYIIDSRDRNTIAMASVLHDIGKLAIPDNILNKPGRLTDEEFEIMKTHTTLGADMLERLDIYDDSTFLIRTAREICRWHHERWDGKGYPDGLKGDDIPISAQVVSLADVYDALTSDRVYKPAYTHEQAMDMILGGQCGTFNPLLLECLKDVQERILTEIKPQDRTEIE